MTAPTEAPTVDAFYDQELESVLDDEAKCEYRNACNSGAEFRAIFECGHGRSLCANHADEARGTIERLPELAARLDLFRCESCGATCHMHTVRFEAI